MSNKKFYITTTAPYVNSKPHIGFALEIIQADVLARYHTLVGDDVFFNTGTDEHGKKIYEKALEENKDPQDYVDEYATKFDLLKEKLNLSYNSFWRTTNPEHIRAAQEIWKRVDKEGYIEKGVYKAKYCVGCELEKQDSELVDGRCPLHPNKEIELIEEENYFFKFSELAPKLLEYYDQHPDFVIPSHRQKEIRNFVEEGLEDFSISRLKEKMPWGIEVPGDPKHVQYVWFDALTYYISALGWPDNQEKFGQFWGTIEKPNSLQVAGKDNLRQQTAMWQAMLLAAGLPPTRQIFIHGFITSGGQKMSKSLGNVVDPIEYVEKYGTDALRYYLLAKINPSEDSDFTKEKFEEVYNADLANGLGNLVSRVAKLAELQSRSGQLESSKFGAITKEIDSFKFDQEIGNIWSNISVIDGYISEEKLWENTDKKLDVLDKAIANILQIAYDLKPFLPETAAKIEDIFTKPQIKSAEPLFPRLK